MFFAVSLAMPAAVSADPASPISVVVTGSPNPVASGSQLTWTIVSTNIGSAKVDNVVLTDQIQGVGVIQTPPALPQLQITSTKGSCTQGGADGLLVRCDVGSMAGREAFTVTIRGQVTAAGGVTLNNTAAVTGTKSAQTFNTNGTSSVLVSAGGSGGLPDLTINKTGPTSVTAGTALDYTLTINNLGSSNASNIKVVDTLPAGITTLGSPAFETTSLFSCSATPAPITVTCTGGAVNAGQNGSIKIHAIAPATGPITNTAVVDPDNSIAETNELNNTSASVNTTVGGTPPPSLLTINKTDGNPADALAVGPPAAGPDPVNPGEKLVYRIQVRNNATSRADDVVVTDGTNGLEASTLVVSQTLVGGTVGNTGGCAVIAPQIRCAVRTLDAGGTLTITITGFVIAPAGTTLFGSATVSGNIKNVGVTATDTESTLVRPSTDFTVTKVDSPDPVCARSWPRNTPPAGETGHLLNPPDGLGAATGQVEPPALLAPAVCLGGLTYDYVIGNSGNGNAVGNVTLRDPLPAGLIFDSYANGSGTDNGGFHCKLDTGNVVLCTGGSINAASTVKLSIRLVAPPNIGSITNTVTIDPNNAVFEPDETNNTATATTTVGTGVDLVVWKGDKNGQDVPGSTVPNLDEGFDPIATNGTGTYTLIVDNVGPQDTTGIKVRDTLPAGVRFLSYTADSGFTCTHDGSPTGGNVTCIGGSLPGTESEFYTAAGGSPAAGGEKWATIKIKFFATNFVQPKMRNVVRVDPDNEIPEINENNNFAQDETVVGVGNDDKGAFNQLTITKTQLDPSPSATPADPSFDVATNGTLVYDLKVENLGTDPVSNIVVKDFLPTGTRFRAAVDTDSAVSLSDAFFCTHDGSATGGIVTCVSGDLSGTVTKIPRSGGGDVPTVRHIKITLFAPNAPGTIQNLGSVDPDNAVAEGNEFDNDSFVTTNVTVGGNNMFNELNLTKTQTDPTATCGAPTPLPCVSTSSIVTYELVVKNDGSDPAFQVQVRDTLPAGFSFISADDKSDGPNAFQCMNIGQAIECIAARIDGGGAGNARTIVVRAFAATQPGVYTNQAVVDPNNNIPEGNETNNTAQQKTRVVVGNGFIDLKIQKCDQSVADGDDDPGCSVDSDPVAPSGTITYVLTVSNGGTDPAFNVKVTDILPAGTTFVSADDQNTGDGAFSCAYASGVITCTGGTLDGSQDLIAGVDTSTTIKVVLTAPAAKGPVTNQAFVDPDNAIAESNETNNHDTETTNVVPRINLVLDKQGPESAHQNDEDDYIITVENQAPTGDGLRAENVVIVDALPIGLIPLSVKADPGNFICDFTENPVNGIRCVGNLEDPDGPNSDKAKVTITVHVFVTAKEGPLDNEACVDPTSAELPNGTIIESNEGDNCKTKTTVVLNLSPDLHVQKTADATNVTPGQEFSYKVVVSNNGDATADMSGVTITDKLDTSKVDHVSSSADNSYSCTFSTPNVECTGGNLAPGDAVTVTIKVKVKTGATGTIVNEASVPDDTPFDSGAAECGSSSCANEAAANTTSGNGDNKDTVNVSVGGSGIDLVMLSLDDSEDATTTGGIETYTAKVSNNGTADASSVLIRLELPSTGLNHVLSSASNGFACTFLFPNIDCTGNLASGASTTVTLVTSVTASAPPDKSVVVKATVDPNNTIVEDDETNNTKSQTTTVSGSCATGCVDLVASPIVVSPATVHVGDTATFIIGVGNAGSDTTGDFKIDLKLDGAGFDFDGGGFEDTQPSNDYSATPGATTGFECTTAFPVPAGHVECHGDLNGGQGVLIILKVHVTSDATGFLNLHLTADSGSSESEFSESNNTTNASVKVEP